VRTPDGTIEGIVVVSRDVTEQRLAERAGREAERRFEIAFDRAPIGMALIGVDASVERVNAALAGITGRSAEELAALRHEELLHPDDEELAAEAFASLLADDGMATELRIVHADGHPVWVSLRATIVRDEEGTPVHVLVQVQDITDRRSLEDQLRHLADHDPLTGLLNRRGFTASWRREPAEGDDPPRMTLVLIDLDLFKDYNDVHGHQAGDDLLRWVGTELQATVRRTDSVARLGGDEFAVLMPETDARAAAPLVERIEERLARRAPHSLGTASSPENGAALEDLYRVADAGLYKTKLARAGGARLLGAAL
jgi:diguanylate cyclase (GGDEF)-like protein/PAS domain S-box-containing protein